MNLRLLAFLGFSVTTALAADVAGGAGQSGSLKSAPRSPVYPPKNTPDAAKSNFAKAKVPAGFSADLWASEPLLANPVAFCFDPQGRMFVSETHRYRTSVLDIRHYYWMIEDDLAARNQEEWLTKIKKNFPKDWKDLEKESELIRLVVDSDGDGKADQTSVYADGFNSALDGIASGVLWDNGGLYFANIPALWRLEGRDKAEKREVLHTGYGVRFSYTGHDFHGLIKGPDGRIYFSIGDRGASIPTKEGGRIEVPDEGAVLRCEPDGSKLELVMRGLRNPQELAFDDHGNLFTGDNDSDQGDRERWVYIVEGADAGWRVGWQHHLLGKEYNPWLAESMWEPRDAKKKQPAYILPPIANLPDGPSGLAHYPGTGLPSEYLGTFFLAGYKGSTAKSQVNTFKSEPDGAGFKLTGLRVFLDNVQATDVDFGPDSRLYVSAWDEGWERSDQGRIIRLGHDEARTAQAVQIAEVQKILADGFSKRSTAELLKLLAHADQRVRLNAQWALTDQLVAAPEKTLPALTTVIHQGAEGAAKSLSRLHAIWAVSHFARITQAKAPAGNRTIVRPSADMVKLAADADAEVRAQTIRTFSELRGTWSPEALKLITSKLADTSPRVRFFAALALAKSAEPSAAPAVFTMLRENDGKDLHLQHAGVMALAGLNNPAELAKAAKDTSRSIRLAALLAERHLGSERIANFLNDADPALVREAAIAINDVPISAAMPALAALPIADSKDGALVTRVLNANFRLGDAASAARVAQFAANSKDDGLRQVALTMLTQWGNPPARDYVVSTYRPLPARNGAPAAQAIEPLTAKLLETNNEKLLIAAAEALSANPAPSAGAALATLVKNSSAPGKARLAALNALAKLKAPELDAALTTASTDADAALHTAATKLLGTRNPDTAAAQFIKEWPTAKPDQKQDIATALGDTKSPKAGEFLAKLVEGIANEPAEAHLEILEAAAKHEQAKDALAKYDAVGKAAKNPLVRFQMVLKGGDAVAGKKLFNEHPVAACLRCHKVEGTGGEAGPDLTGFAKQHDRNYMLESIVNVNAKIAPGFQMVVLTLKDGNVKAGMVKAEDASTLTLQNPGAPAEQVKVADIAKREAAPSGMLPNIGDLISRRELRDIIEYMASLK